MNNFNIIYIVLEKINEETYKYLDQKSKIFSTYKWYENPNQLVQGKSTIREAKLLLRNLKKVIKNKDKDLKIIRTYSYSGDTIPQKFLLIEEITKNDRDE